VAEDRLERRLVFVGLVVLLVWIVLAARLFYLQVVQGDRFRVSAERNSVRTHRVEPPRGMILDRNGSILVDSRPAFDVLLVPHETPKLSETVERVAHLVGFDAEPVSERVAVVRGRARFQPQRLAADVDRNALARVESRLWALPGVLTRVTPVRSYLDGDSAAHVLGTLGEISPAQLESRRFAGYRRGDVIGRSGMEALFDRELRGRAGGRHLLVDAHGRELEELGAVESQPGNNLVLTLDRRLQLAAEQAIDETGHGGALVALDPRTGEVLALTSRPAFNPNDFATGLDTEAWDRLLGDPRKLLQNRALQGQYPPGSTYKVVTAIAGLEEGVITPETSIDCNGWMRLGRRRYRCWRRGGHGEVNLHRALVQSCDIYFYQVGRGVGVDPRAQDRHRVRERERRPGPDGRLEGAPLPGAVGRGGDALDRDRAGLQPLDAGPARGRLRGGRERREPDAALPRRARRDPARRGPEGRLSRAGRRGRGLVRDPRASPQRVA
jgi:penicillin-binding protein 2